jgi:serine protease Do
MTRVLILVFAVALIPPARAEKPRSTKPAADTDGAWFIDDDELYDDFMSKLRELAKAEKCLPAAKLKDLVSEDRTSRVTPVKPSTEKLDPEDVYKKVLPGVFLIGSVLPDIAENNEPDEKKDDKKDDKGEKIEKDKAGDGFLDGRLATAWVLTADGVLVTNWHVFDATEDGEVFGVMDHRGKAYPVIDVLAVNKAADIAVIKVDAKGLTPLAVADKPASVGAWVAVLGHPGDRYYTFTQGSITRYSKMKREDGATERWMSITADYAYGSSGSPVVDRTGAVVGMAALTENLDYPDAEPIPPAGPKDGDKKPEPATKPDEKPQDPDKKPEEAPPPVAKGSSLQMVMKLAVPAGEIRKTIWAK